MRRTAAITSLILFLSSLIFTGAVPAQAEATATPGVVQGTLTEAETGTALPGACAHVYDGQWREAALACTDDTGHYTTTQLTLGYYRIEFTATGHADTWYTVGGQSSTVFGSSQINVTNGATANGKLRAHYGTVQGRLADTTGHAKAMMSVYAYLEGTSGSVATTRTKADGSFEFIGLTPGRYSFLFSGYCVDQQWVRDPAGVAAKFAVGDGGTATVQYAYAVQSCSATGVFAGKVIDAVSGAVIPNASFRIVVHAYNFELAAAISGADGTYRVEGIVPSGTVYRIQASATGYPQQWANGGSIMSAGGSFSPTSTEIPLSTHFGTLRGRITDPSGQPVAATVTVLGTGKAMGSVTQVAAADGTYSFAGLAATEWTLRVSHPTLGTQWYHELPTWTTPASATRLTVAADTTTVVDEQYAERAHVAIQLLDDTTGQPVVDACVTAFGTGIVSAPKTCVSDNGLYHLDLPASEVELSIASPSTFNLQLPMFQASAGQTYSMTTRLTPAGRISLTVQKNADGSVPSVCVSVVPQTHIAPGPTEPGPGGGCNYLNGAPTETFTTSPLAIGQDVRLFVRPIDTNLGAQWLGLTGGTGQRESAAVLRVVRGTIAAPLIKLDPAGHVVGYAYNATSIYPTAVRPGGMETGHLWGCSYDAGYQDCADSSGYFDLTLGPYAWPLEFDNPMRAHTWSGGATSRVTATLVQVKAGQQVRHDVWLQPGRRFAITAPPSISNLTLDSYDAKTGDGAGFFTTSGFDSLSAGPLLIRATYSENEAYKSCWLYRTGSDRRLTGVFYPGTPEAPTALTITPGVNCLAAVPSLLAVLPRR